MGSKQIFADRNRKLAESGERRKQQYNIDRLPKYATKSTMPSFARPMYDRNSPKDPMTLRPDESIFQLNQDSFNIVQSLRRMDDKSAHSDGGQRSLILFSFSPSLRSFFKLRFLPKGARPGKEERFVPIELSIAWTVLLNIIGWPIIQFGWALAITSMPAAKFGNPTFFSWEVNGHIYRHHLAIAKWKHWLLDAASLFGISVFKQELGSNCRNELQSFVREVRRGEIYHWCAMMSAPIFFLWNPAWADLVMLAFGAAINLPCIASLRYARLRLTRILRTSHRM